MKFIILGLFVLFGIISAEYDSLSWHGMFADVTVQETSGLRKFFQSTTMDIRTSANRQNGMPYQSVYNYSYSEISEDMKLKTNNVFFDSLFALAQSDAHKLAVTTITDGAFQYGNPINCGGCYQTGDLWTYVWTRDTSFATFLGLAKLNPQFALNSMMFKISSFRSGYGEGVEVVQDTGSGGSWPISSDRVSWALGAYELLKYLEGDSRSSFLSTIKDVLRFTLDKDRKVVFEPQSGLYYGEESFLDWREQTYPTWFGNDGTANIGMSKALSTNLLHLNALRVASELFQSDPQFPSLSAKYQQWADSLASSIQQTFWSSEDGMFASMTGPNLNPSLFRKFDMLGESLAVLMSVGTPQQQSSILASYPHVDSGVSVTWPQLPGIPVYHNRAIWPFVSAFGLKAACKIRNAAAVTHNTLSLFHLSAFSLTNYENLEFSTGKPFFEDGGLSGPVVDSTKQVWSVAGYISLVLDTVLGMQTSLQGLRFEPCLTGELRSQLFPTTDLISLSDIKFRGITFNLKVNLPAHDPSLKFGFFTVSSATLDGKDVTELYLPPSSFSTARNSELVLTLKADLSSPTGSLKVVDPAKSETFSPYQPSLNSVWVAGDGTVNLSFQTQSGVTETRIYRDGELHSTLIGAASSYSDSSTASSKETKRNHCYFVTQVKAGLESHPSSLSCSWPSGSIWEVEAGSSSFNLSPPHQICNSGDSSCNFHNRVHYPGWGKPNEVMEIKVSAPYSGPYLFSLVYGNSMGPINTGVTCAVKHVQVYLSSAPRTPENLQWEGTVFMPHLSSWDTWGSSNEFGQGLQLVGGQSYTIVITDSNNMSYLSHFEHYTPSGSSSPWTFDPNNIANIAAIKTFYMGPIA